MYLSMHYEVRATRTIPLDYRPVPYGGNASRDAHYAVIFRDEHLYTAGPVGRYR